MSLTLRRYSPTTLLLGGLALLVSACTPNLGEMPSLQKVSNLLSPKTFTAPTAEWPTDTWWQKYNDPQLTDLITKAFSTAPDMSIAQARLEAAAAAARQQGAALYPTLAANASAQQVRQSYNNGAPPGAIPQGWNDSGRATLDLTWQLDFWGKNRALLASATSQAEAARAEATAARLILATSVAQSYATLAQQYAERTEAIRDAQVRASTARLMKQRMQNGLENLGSLRQAEARQASAEAEIASLDAQINQTRHRLAALVGQGPDFALSLTTPTLVISQTFSLPENLEVNLVGRRPDLVAARLRAEAAAQGIHAARADYYPNINLSAYIGREALGINLLDKSTSTVGAIGPAINLPIFTGGRLEGAYRGARATYDEAVATYNKTLANALAEVADAATSTQALTTQLEKTAAAVQASQQAYTIANNRYKGGLATYLDVLNAEDTLIATRRTYTTLQSQSLLLDIALIRALGGGLAPSPSTPPPQESPAT